MKTLQSELTKYRMFVSNTRHLEGIPKKEKVMSARKVNRSHKEVIELMRRIDEKLKTVPGISVNQAIKSTLDANGNSLQPTVYYYQKRKEFTAKKLAREAKKEAAQNHYREVQEVNSDTSSKLLKELAQLRAENAKMKDFIVSKVVQ